MKLAVLFLEYDPVKYENAFARFKGYADRLRGCDIHYYLIDNRKTGEGASRISNSLYRLDGDNSGREFSGWQKGLTYLHSRLDDYDAILFGNDAFLAYGWSLLEFADRMNLNHWRRKYPSAIGQIDTKGIYLEAFGHDVSRWICTNCFFLSRPMIENIGSVVSLTDNDMDTIISPQFPGHPKQKDYAAYFRKDCPLNDNYKQMAVTWLTGEWHGKFEIQEATWDLFRTKLRSLINESLLTARILHCGYSIESYKNYLKHRPSFFSEIFEKMKFQRSSRKHLPFR